VACNESEKLLQVNVHSVLVVGQKTISIEVENERQGHGGIFISLPSITSFFFAPFVCVCFFQELQQRFTENSFFLFVFFCVFAV